jgi:hypothetical protein
MKNLIDPSKRFVASYSFHILIFITFITIYSITMYPGAGGRINHGDSIKWQFLHLANGIPHSTGYPQFLILSEIFSRIIFFLEMPERITFISVFFGALSMTVFYSLAYVLTKDKIGSLLSTIFTGCTYVFWVDATEAEVYTLNIFYLLSVFYLFIQFYITKKSSYYLTGCAIYALSFGNHLSMITILPAIAFIALITDYKIVFTPKNILLVVMFVIIGMLQYSFIYFRAHSPDIQYAEITLKPTFENFVAYITGSGSQSLMFAFSFEKVLFERFVVLYNYINLNFTIFGVMLAFAGFFYYLYVKRQYAIITFLTLALTGQIIFNVNYDVGDIIVFFTPIYIIIGIFISLLFAASKDLVFKMYLAVLAFFTISYNINNRNILTVSTYGPTYFRPILSLYLEQKDSLPLYYRSEDYGMYTYMSYLNFSGDLPPGKSIAAVMPAYLDSFYVAKNPAFYPELADQYDVKPVMSESIYDFIRKRHTPDNIIFLSAMDEAKENLSKELINYLQQYGSKIETLPFRSSYAGVLHDNKIVEAISDLGPVSIKADSTENAPLKGELNYEVKSAGFPLGNISEIKINGLDYSIKGRGINIVVYNINSEKVIDMINFDTHTGEPKTLFKAFRKNL